MSDRMTKEELEQICENHELGKLLFDERHYVHADRGKLLAELVAVTRERDGYLVERDSARDAIRYAARDGEQRGYERGVAEMRAAVARRFPGVFDWPLANLALTQLSPTPPQQKQEEYSETDSGTLEPVGKR